MTPSDTGNETVASATSTVFWFPLVSAVAAGHGTLFNGVYKVHQKLNFAATNGAVVL
tara:strand:+ start:5732 stop:5902 length:171 start_codon:yes stop_codon:yes gene_type:complete